MVKIAMMGAGSAVFVKNLLTDILNFTELGRVVISLHDIDPERLETGGMMARWMCEHHVTDIDAMRGFDSDGYRFDAAESSADQWRFVRS